jgi:ubiquinone/menaquinone biosynthesis C-methylase UbiE
MLDSFMNEKWSRISIFSVSKILMVDLVNQEFEFLRHTVKSSESEELSVLIQTDNYPLLLHDEIGHTRNTEILFYDEVAIKKIFEPDNGLIQLEKLQATYSSYKDAGLKAIDSFFEGSIQKLAINELSLLESGSTFLQIGGTGAQALKHLLMGGGFAVLVTPSLGEAIAACHRAAKLNVLNRFYIILGKGEQLPFKDHSFDVVYYGGSLHHTEHKIAIQESHRVLSNQGIFMALEAVEAPGYKVAIKVLKKREPEVECIILTKRNCDEICDDWNAAKITYGGAFLRYLYLGLEKVGITFSSGVLIQSQILLDGLLPSRVRKIFGSVALIQIRKS